MDEILKRIYKLRYFRFSVSMGNNVSESERERRDKELQDAIDLAEQIYPIYKELYREQIQLLSNAFENLCDRIQFNNDLNLLFMELKRIVFDNNGNDFSDVNIKGKN